MKLLDIPNRFPSMIGDTTWKMKGIKEKTNVPVLFVFSLLIFVEASFNDEIAWF